MTKVVLSDAKPASRVKLSDTSVMSRQVTEPDGRRTTIRLIDPMSKTLGADILYVFRQNVAKARRENKRLLGSADGVRRGK